MEVSGDKKSTRMRFDISPLFFSCCSTLVWALVITHDEIFQAVAVEDVLLPKPWLDVGVDGVVRWKSPISLTNVFGWQTATSVLVNDTQRTICKVPPYNPDWAPSNFRAFETLQKTSPTPAIYIWRHRQNRSPEMASGAEHLLPSPGLGKSHRAF
jgi:hypothetical protein